MNKQDKLHKLRELLLEEDRVLHDKVDSNLKELAALINEREQLEGKVNPILEDRLSKFEKDIPRKMGPAITAALQKQIADSQNEVVDLLYPIIGKLISKFIRIEIQKVSERIDEQLSNAFSLDGWIRRVKAWFNGTSETDLMLRDITPPLLEEMFIIEKGSGLLLGSYSKNKTVDQDMIAGMLTAIKSFVEDAFNKGAQELEVVEYESYKIHLFNFQSYYIAMVISGVINADFLLSLQDTVLEFTERYKSYHSRHEQQNNSDITPLLKELFDE